MSFQGVVITAACWVGILLILAAIENTKAWERFKADHHCKPMDSKRWHCDSGELTK